MPFSTTTNGTFDGRGSGGGAGVIARLCGGSRATAEFVDQRASASP
jgi:hypothetical protein